MTPTESKTTGTVGNFPHGSRETPATSASPMEADRSEKARGHKSDMHVAGESDSSIVPEKPANKGGVPLPAESVEGRGLTKENTEQSLLDRTQRRNSDGTPFVPRSRGLLGVREAARKDKKLKFTSLLHHLTPELLRASFFELKKQAAPGVDGETWRDYAEDFEQRIDDLHGSNPSRSLPGQALQADLHPQAGWQDATAGNRRPGGQDRPTGGAHGSGMHLRTGLSGVQLRLSSRTKPSPSLWMLCSSVSRSAK